MLSWYKQIKLAFYSLPFFQWALYTLNKYSSFVFDLVWIKISARSLVTSKHYSKVRPWTTHLWARLAESSWNAALQKSQGITGRGIMPTAQPWWVASIARDRLRRNASTVVRGLWHVTKSLGICWNPEAQRNFWQYTICCMESASGAKHLLGCNSSTSWAVPACLQHFKCFLNIKWCSYL